MSSWLQDVRVAFRSLRKSPGFTSIAVLTLALGIGATTAIFSVVHGVLLRPLPYPEPDALMQVETVFDSGATGNVSNPDFEDLRTQNRSFASLAAYSSWTTSAVVSGRGARLDVAAVSGNFFKVLGVQPMRGRTFLAAEEAAGRHLAIVSYEYWRDQLGKGALRDQVVRLGDQPFDVVGVMPRGFDFPQGTELWVLRQVQTSSRTAQNWQVVGRLQKGVSPAEAQLDISAIARRIRKEYGTDTYMTDAALNPLKEGLVGDVRRALWVLLAASGLLLLVACVNVANLVLTRGISRGRELALQLALGARPAHLLRRFLSESLLLSMVGAALGVVFAVAGVPALLALAPQQLPRAESVSVDWPVLTFAFSLCVTVALVIGLVPAFRASRRDPRDSLTGGQRGVGSSMAHHRVRGALVASQMALTIVLMVGVGLLGRSFVKLSTADPGYRTHGAVVMDLWLPSTGDAVGARRNAAFLDRLLKRLRALPGVERAGGVNVFPLEGGNAANGTFLVLQRPDEVTSFDDFNRLVHKPERTGEAEYRVASDGYFATMGIPLIRGRLFDERDGPDTANVALISAALAQTRWPGQDPLGKFIQFGNMDGNLRPFRIVGIVGNIRERGMGASPRPTFYASSRQRSVSGFHIVLRGRLDVGALASSARRVVRGLNPEVPLRFQTLSQVVSASMADRRFVLWIMAIFAGLALVLATTGVYGVIAYTASQRTSEIGVRMALGARSRDVVGLLVRQGAGFVLTGVLVGVGAALVFTRFLRSFCYGVTPTDPASFVTTVGFLLAAAIAASWIPAHRASRIDPMEALRHE